MRQVDNRGITYVTVLLLKADLGTHTDPDGRFSFTGVPSGKDILDCSLLGYMAPKRMDLEVIEDSTVFIRIDLAECEYDRFGRGICPACNRSDQAVPIVYGEPTKGTLRKAKKGKVFPGGSVISGCDPSWYCKSDKVKF